MKIANDRQVKHPRTGRRPVSLPALEDLVRPHPPRVIQDDAAYENAQEVVDGLTNVANLTAGQTEYLETLSLLMESYETEHHAIETADLSPLESLKYLILTTEIRRGAQRKKEYKTNLSGTA